MKNLLGNVKEMMSSWYILNWVWHELKNWSLNESYTKRDILNVKRKARILMLKWDEWILLCGICEMSIDSLFCTAWFMLCSKNEFVLAWSSLVVIVRPCIWDVMDIYVLLTDFCNVGLICLILLRDREISDDDWFRVLFWTKMTLKDIILSDWFLAISRLMLLVWICAS